MTKRIALTVVSLSLLLVPAAQAGPLVQSAPEPDAIGALERPFERWLDPFSYVLAPSGSFEGGAAGWSLGTAKVVSGNEPFYVHAVGESQSLSIPSGTSVTSPTVAVGLDKPLLRFFARSSGGLLSALKVEVQFELANGTVATLPIGVVLPGGWSPTLPLPIVANLLPLLPDEQTPVRFRFTPVGGASWLIDDVYVDPRRQ